MKNGNAVYGRQDPVLYNEAATARLIKQLLLSLSSMSDNTNLTLHRLMLQYVQSINKENVEESFLV